MVDFLCMDLTGILRYRYIQSNLVLYVQVLDLKADYKMSIHRGM